MKVDKKHAILGIIIIGIVVTGTSLGIFLLSPEPVESKLFIAIHCEPGTLPQSVDYPEQYWLDLRAMIIEADIHDIKLTLLFNPQWATYILNDTNRLTMVRNWDANGHEIGLHHHGAHMNNWNGYTNQADYQTGPKYLGTISDMMTLMNQLPASGQINTACVATDEDIDYDFPLDVPFRTFGGSDKLGHLWSTPETSTYNEQTVLGVSHARFADILSEVNIDLDEFKGLVVQNQEEVMGLVWHVFNYADNPSAFISLFEYLDDEGIDTWTVSEIMESYSATE